MRKLMLIEVSFGLSLVILNAGCVSELADDINCRIEASQKNGTIGFKGTVVDETGRPIEDLEVVEFDGSYKAVTHNVPFATHHAVEYESAPPTRFKVSRSFSFIRSGLFDAVFRFTKDGYSTWQDSLHVGQHTSIVILSHEARRASLIVMP